MTNSTPLSTEHEVDVAREPVELGDDQYGAVGAGGGQPQDDATLRITRWDFEPGAVTGWHEHGWPYFVIMLEADTLRLHNGTEITDVPLTKGQAYMRPAGIKHDVMNASPHAISFVEIEMKQPEGIANTVA